MKCLAAAALVMVLMALPVCAQRASAHGGFSGHAAPASHGGGVNAAHGFAPGNGFAPGRGYAPARGVAPAAGRYPGFRGPDGRFIGARTMQRNGSGAFISRPPYSGLDCRPTANQETGIIVGPTFPHTGLDTVTGL